MRKLLCLVAILGAFAAAGCGDDEDDTGGTGTNTGAQCQPASVIGNCTKLEACCTNAPQCWYNVEKGGTTKKYDCAGSDCQAAAQEVATYCQ